MTPWQVLAAAILGSFAAAVLLTWLFRRYALARNLLDTPNERSSHMTPTPRGGGLAIVFAASLGLAATVGPTGVPLNVAAAFLGGGAVVALTGWIDDHGHVRPLHRIMSHLAAAAWAVMWLGPVNLTALGLPGGAAGAAITWPLSILIVAWLLNLFNFMDGIDGIAGSEAVLVSAGGLAALWLSSDLLDARTAAPFALLAAGAAGFLIWNWPPALVFMGDAGSGFVGYWIGCLVLLSANLLPNAGVALLIIAGVFVADATVTLLHRLIRGERVYEAHRSHAYQRLARKWEGHQPVTVASIAVTCIFLAPIAWLVASGRLHPLAGFAVAYLPLAAAVWLAGAGKAND